MMKSTCSSCRRTTYRSPGKILSVTVPTFEALTQFGTATVTAKNIGKLEASYSLTFDCSRGVTLMEEQFFIMKPDEVSIRSFKLYPTTDQAARYICAAILKDSDFIEVDRADCQFTTTATILDNGTEITPDQPKSGINGVLGSIRSIWKKLGVSIIDFITGRTCRSKCSRFFDFNCHIQYICFSWIVLFGLLLALFPTVLVLVWLLHQKGFFDPLYDWWEDRGEARNDRTIAGPKHGVDVGRHHAYSHKNHKHERRKHKYNRQNKRRISHYAHHQLNKHGHLELEADYYHHKHRHHAHKDRHRHKRPKKVYDPTYEYLEYDEHKTEKGRL